VTVVRRPFYDDGSYLEWDPDERAHNADIYGPEGEHVIRIALPLYRVEALTEALRLLEQLGKVFDASEHIPCRWEDLLDALNSLTHDHALVK